VESTDPWQHGHLAAVLSERLRLLCDDAVERARDDGRKTLMARDFRRKS